MRYFELQFKLAEETQLPMFLHSRATSGAMVDVLKANRGRFTTGVVHSFDGDAEEAAAIVALDLYIGAL
jgi:TatD DNase family protein